MKRWVYCSRTVTGDPAALRAALDAHARDLLRADEPGDVFADGSFPVRVEVHLGVRLHPMLRVHLGVAAHRTDGRHVLPIHWSGDAVEAATPHFDGMIELEPLSSNVGRLSIVGSYTPPLGLIGTAADAMLLRRVAEDIVEVLLGRLAGGLGSPWPSHTIEPPAALTVADVMTPDPVVLESELPLRTAALLLFGMNISGAPVVTGEGDLLGVLSERDLLDKEAPPPRGFGRDATESWRRRDALTVGEACTRPALTTAPGVTLQAVTGELLQHRVGRLVVIDAGQIVGIISRHDVLRALLRSDEEIAHVAADRLARLHEPEVDISVEWGVVRLTGTVSCRSRLPVVVAEVSHVDGVVAVNSDDVIWAVDDVVTYAPML